MIDHQSIELAVADLASQRDLFPAGEIDALTADVPLVEAARTVRRPVTGSRVTKDEARCLVIGAMKCQGASDRKIAAAMKCDPRSIPGIMDHLEASGIVPALKDRVARKVAHLAESTADELQEQLNTLVTDRDTAAMIKALSVLLGISVEKALLLMGQATEIRANVRAGDVLSAEDLAAWVNGGAASPNARTEAPADSKSDVSASNGHIIEVSGSSPTDSPTNSAPTPGSAVNGGEGVRGGGALGNVDGSGPSQNFSHGGDASGSPTHE